MSQTTEHTGDCYEGKAKTYAETVELKTMERPLRTPCGYFTTAATC